MTITNDRAISIVAVVVGVLVSIAWFEAFGSLVEVTEQASKLREERDAAVEANQQPVAWQNAAEHNQQRARYSRTVDTGSADQARTKPDRPISWACADVSTGTDVDTNEHAEADTPTSINPNNGALATLIRTKRESAALVKSLADLNRARDELLSLKVALAGTRGQQAQLARRIADLPTHSPLHQELQFRLLESARNYSANTEAVEQLHDRIPVLRECFEGLAHSINDNIEQIDRAIGTQLVVPNGSSDSTLRSRLQQTSAASG